METIKMQSFEHNSLERFIFDNHGVRGEIVKLKKPFEDLLHDSYPLAVKKVLMELAVSSVLVASTLKDGSEIMVQIRGTAETKLKYALINIRQDLSFYGSVALNENATVTDSDTLLDLCGSKSVLVLSVFPKDGPKWQGIVAINPESISATLEDYFRDSQQLPTRFFIRTDLKDFQSGGILLQIIPEIDKNIESLEDLSVLADTITEDELFNLSLEQNLARLFAHEEVKVFGQNEVLYKCICSKDRCLNALSEIPSSELLDMANSNEVTSITCQHCNKTYTFTKEELLNLVHQKNQ